MKDRLLGRRIRKFRVQMGVDTRDDSIGSGEYREHMIKIFTGPIGNRIDYASIGRKAFFVEPLPEGALPIYDYKANEE